MTNVIPLVPNWSIVSRVTGYRTTTPVSLERATEGARLLNSHFGVDHFRAVPYKPGHVNRTPPRAA